MLITIDLQIRNVCFSYHKLCFDAYHVSNDVPMKWAHAQNVANFLMKTDDVNALTVLRMSVLFIVNYKGDICANVASRERICLNIYSWYIVKLWKFLVSL